MLTTSLNVPAQTVLETLEGRFRFHVPSRTVCCAACDAAVVSAPADDSTWHSLATAIYEHQRHVHSASIALQLAKNWLDHCQRSAIGRRRVQFQPGAAVCDAIDILGIHNGWHCSHDGCSVVTCSELYKEKHARQHGEGTMRPSLLQRFGRSWVAVKQPVPPGGDGGGGSGGIGSAGNVHVAGSSNVDVDYAGGGGVEVVARQAVALTRMHIVSTSTSLSNSHHHYDYVDALGWHQMGTLEEHHLMLSGMCRLNADDGVDGGPALLGEANSCILKKALTAVADAADQYVLIKSMFFALLFDDNENAWWWWLCSAFGWCALERRSICDLWLEVPVVTNGQQYTVAAIE